MPDTALIANTPNTANTVGQNIADTKTNFDRIQAHMDNAVDTHGVAALSTSKADYETHKANTTTAHGIDTMTSNISAVQSEVQGARGAKTTLDSRLSVALQSDGSIKLSTLASRYIDNGDVPTFISSVSFSVPADRTKVYIAGEILRATVATGYVYGIVATSVYAGGITTVTLVSDYPVLTNPISKVEIALLSFDNTIEQAVAQNAANITDLQNQITAYMASQIVSKSAAYEYEDMIYEVHGDATGGAFNLTLPRSVKAPVANSGNGGTLTLSSSGVYTGTGTKTFKVQIDGTGTPNTFKWSNDNGATWEVTGVAITGSAQVLQEGVSITFSGTTGGVINDSWIMVVRSNKGRTIEARKIDSGVNAVTLVPAETSETIEGAANLALSSQYAKVKLRNYNGKWWK